MLRYFFDEHVVDAIAEQLRRRGVDVLTAHAAAMANLSESIRRGPSREQISGQQ